MIEVKWISVKDKLPEVGRAVLAYSSKPDEGCWRAVYTRSLTWGGYVMAFTNTMSKFPFRIENVTHWSYLNMNKPE